VAKKTSMAIGGRQEAIDNINKPNCGVGTSVVTQVAISVAFTCYSYEGYSRYMVCSFIAFTV
jgi:hypothetical protein